MKGDAFALRFLARLRRLTFKRQGEGEENGRLNTETNLQFAL